MPGIDVHDWARRFGPIRLRRRAQIRRELGHLTDEPGQGPLQGDPEVELLIELWTMGVLPAYMLQRIGAAACLIAPRPQMRALANLGAEGRYPANAASQLRALLRLNDNKICEPLLVDMPMWNATGHPPTVVVTKFPIMLPHEIMGSLYSHYPHAFQTWFSGEAGDIDSFWSSIRNDDPRMWEHPVQQIEGYRQHCVPLRIHGDGVPFGKSVGHTLDVLSFSSMLGRRGDSWCSRMLILGIANVCKVNIETHGLDSMRLAWKWVIWSFSVLSSGVWPTHGPDLEPLQGRRWQKRGRICGRFSFCMFQIAGDLDWLCNYLGLPHFNSANDPCMFCKANRGDRPWSDFKNTSSWVATIKHGEELRVACHGLFTAGLGLTLAHICPDILHCLDLGGAQHLVASVLFMLVWDADIAGPLDARIRHVVAELQSSYESFGTPNGERVPQAKVHKLFEKSRSANPTQYPFMRVKGAQGRHAVPAVLDVCRRLVPNHRSFQHCIRSLEGLCNFYDAVTPHGLFLPAFAIHAAQAGMSQYLVHYQRLCFDNMMSGRKLFHVTEKCHHYPWHIAWVCQYYNPKAGWTYLDEDFMGKISTLLSSSIKGLGPLRVGPSFMFRYRQRLHLRLVRDGAAV